MARVQDVQNLIRRSLDGDRRAYGQLARLMEPRVRRFIQRRVSQADVVDDLVQKTFIRLHMSLESFAAHRIRGAGSVDGWVLTAARRTLLDHRRSEYRRRDRLARLSRHYDGVGFVPAPGVEDPEEALSSAESQAIVRQEVRSAIDALPPDSRQIIRRHKLEGESMPSIASNLGIPPVTARVRAHRAYRRLAISLHAYSSSA